MRDVFVSQPNSVAPGFRRGIGGFRRFIKSQGLNPRTLGKTDYGTEPPLDDVRKLMDECVGAIILGCPKSGRKRSVGTDRDAESSTATEWNQIEATVAYERHLPLLIIHHLGMRGGVFDRGAIGKFVYEVDMTADGWPLQKNIMGAVKDLKSKLPADPAASRESMHSDDLTFDRRSGTYVSHDGALRYCHTCLHSPRKERSPLQEGPGGWTCGACKAFYRNPDLRPPEEPDQPKDPMAW